MSRPPTNSRKPLPVNVRLLGWASLLNDVASEMIYPILPQFLITVLGGNRFHLGLIEGFADTIASFLKLWSGGRSDRSGRRKGLVVLGYTLAAVARPIIGLTTLPWQLFAARAGDRIGKGLRTSPRDALIADSTDPTQRGRAFGFHRSMDHLGAAVGPVLATLFLTWRPDRLQELIFLTAVPGALVVLLLAIGLREQPAMTTAGPPRPWSLSPRPFDRNFRLYLGALFLFTLGNSSDAFLLVRAGELGVATPLLPLLWCAFHVLKSAGNLVGGRTVDLWGPRVPLLGGWLIYAGIYLGFAVASSTWQVWIFFLGYALYYALAEPAEKVLAAALSGGSGKGLAFGWYNFVIGVAALPASLIFGFLYDQFGAGAAFGFGALLAVCAVALLCGVRMPTVDNNSISETSAAEA